MHFDIVGIQHRIPFHSQAIRQQCRRHRTQTQSSYHSHSPLHHDRETCSILCAFVCVCCAHRTHSIRVRCSVMRFPGIRRVVCFLWLAHTRLYSREHFCAGTHSAEESNDEILFEFIAFLCMICVHRAACDSGASVLRSTTPPPARTMKFVLSRGNYIEHMHAAAVYIRRIVH